MAPQNLHPPLLHRQINKSINAAARDLGVGETETSRFGQSRQNIARGWAVKLVMSSLYAPRLQTPPPHTHTHYLFSVLLPLRQQTQSFSPEKIFGHWPPQGQSLAN